MYAYKETLRHAGWTASLAGENEEPANGKKTRRRFFDDP